MHEACTSSACRSSWWRRRSRRVDQWELFDLVNDPYELHTLSAEPGQAQLTATLKAELARLKREVRDDDQLADEQLPNGVDGPIARLRGR
jgi:arylsulfatase A-like enzyme